NDLRSTNLGQVKSMGTMVTLRYIMIPIVVAIINLIVYTISPGNMLVSMVLSSVSILILIPSNSTKTANKSTIEDGLTFEEMSKSLDYQDMSFEEQGIHAVMGNVFETMARSAGQDMYSNEITGTEELYQKDNTDKTTSNQEFTTENQFEPDIPVSIVDKPENVRLEVSSDGKLHYVFYEEETGPEIDNSAIKSLSDRVEGVLFLYTTKMSTIENKDGQLLFSILVDHLDKINTIFNVINGKKELEIVTSIWESFEKLIKSWLIENRGILSARKPYNSIKRIVNRVQLPNTEELQYNQLSNYLGKLASIVRFLDSACNYHWLMELYNLTNSIRVMFTDYDIESPKAIKIEVACLLGNCIGYLLDSNVKKEVNFENVHEI
ncbi:MAG: hypothetical protein ACXAC6_19555, partial [Candidatus Hodarchaeales archaeon]